MLSSSSAFQDCPQTPSLMALIKLVVCTRSSFRPQELLCTLVPWDQCCVQTSLCSWQECRACSGVCVETTVHNNHYNYDAVDSGCKVAMQVFGTMPAHRDLSADGVTCRSEGK